MADPFFGHFALDGDTMATEEAHGVDEEAQAEAALFVRLDFRVGKPGMIVDGQVQVFPRGPTSHAQAAALAGDATAGALEATELLDVDVINSPGLLRLKRWTGASGLSRAGAEQHQADRGGQDDQIAGELLPGQALPTQGHDGFLGQGRTALRRLTHAAVRFRWTFVQASSIAAWPHGAAHLAL